MTLTVYTFKDAAGNEFGDFNTQDYDAAKEYAQRYRLLVIGNTYEWSDSEPLDDYTGGDVPPPNMTFEEFQASGRDTPNLAAEVDDYGGDNPGRIYAGGLWIEDARRREGGDGRWYTIVGNAEYQSDNLEHVERPLYEFGVAGGFLTPPAPETETAKLHRTLEKHGDHGFGVL